MVEVVLVEVAPFAGAPVSGNPGGPSTSGGMAPEVVEEEVRFVYTGGEGGSGIVIIAYPFDKYPKDCYNPKYLKQI